MCEQGDVSSRPGLTRRGLLGAISASVLASSLPLRRASAAGTATSPQNAIIGDAALHRIVEGNARYVANKVHVRDFAADRAARARSQHPIASILSCADSRVGPEFIFDQRPGDLFIVRVAGNILEEEGLASFEYGAHFLGAPLIFVLGHSGCGAVSAAIKVVQDNAELPGHLPGLIDHIKPAVVAAQKTQPTNLLDAATVENVRQTMQRVSAAKPILAEMVANGAVKVAGGVYDIATGKVTLV